MRVDRRRSRLRAGLVLLQVLGSALAAPAWAAPGDVTVLAWPEGAASALSITADDGSSSHTRLLRPLLNDRGLRGTFFLVPGWLDIDSVWGIWAEVAAEGHEIASHTYSHSALPELSAEDLAWELSTSRARIQQELGWPHGETFAFPLSQADEVSRQAVVEAGYLAARTGGDRLNPALPDDPFLVQSRHPLSDTPLATVVGWIDELEAEGGWLVLGIHGLSDPENPLPPNHEGWEPVPVARYAAIFDHIAGLPTTWVAPFGEVARYVARRESAAPQVALSAESLELCLPVGPSQEGLWMEVELPAEWVGGALYQVADDGSRVRLEDAPAFLRSALPDGGCARWEPIPDEPIAPPEGQWTERPPENDDTPPASCGQTGRRSGAGALGSALLLLWLSALRRGRPSGTSCSPDRASRAT